MSKKPVYPQVEILDLQCPFCKTTGLKTCAENNDTMLRCWNCGVRMHITNPSALPVGIREQMFPARRKQFFIDHQAWKRNNN